MRVNAKVSTSVLEFGMIVGVHLCFDMTILNRECVICLGMFLPFWMSSSTSIYHFPSNLLFNLQLVIFVNREWIVLVDVKFAVKFLSSLCEVDSKIEKKDVWKCQPWKCLTYLKIEPNILLSWGWFQNRVMYGLAVEMIGSSLLCQAVNNTDDSVWHHTVIIITCLPFPNLNIVNLMW